MSDVAREHHQVPREHHQVPREHHIIGREHHQIARELHPMAREHHPIAREHHPIAREHHPMAREHHPIAREHHPIAREHHTIPREHHSVVREQITDCAYKDQSIQRKGSCQFEPETPPTFPCPIDHCAFASNSGFLEIRQHLPGHHFHQEISRIAREQQHRAGSGRCLQSWKCSLEHLEMSGELVHHYGIAHCLVDSLFNQLAETLLINKFGPSYLQYTCPCDDFICDDKEDLMKHLTFGHYYKLILAEVRRFENQIGFQCPLCFERFGKSEFSESVDINALIGHFGSVHCLTYYYLLTDKTLSQRAINLKKKPTEPAKQDQSRQSEDGKLGELEKEALADYLSPDDNVKIEPIEVDFPYNLDHLPASKSKDGVDSNSKYRPLWTLMDTGQMKPESSYSKEKGSSGLRRNYQQFYKKEDDKWICLTCGTRYDSTHGIHYHLNHTTCGFGDKERIQPKKDFRGFYTREEDKFICLTCGQRYDTIRGVHYHLSNKTCGSDVGMKVGNPDPKPLGEKSKRSPTPKKNYLQFYKKEDGVCTCFGCGTQYQSVHGMHNHLKSTKCGFGDKFKANPKTNYTQFYKKEEDKLICIACGIQYNSMHGMHYHLNSTKCGFGAKEKVTPKKNYQEFYTKIEKSFHCKRCNFKIDYLQGIHRHLRTCCGLNVSVDNLANIEKVVHKEEVQDPQETQDPQEAATTPKPAEDDFFETNMNYIGHDESL